MKKKRILYENIWKMLSMHKQMVFIAGPRQAGKTTWPKISIIHFILTGISLTKSEN